MNSKIIYDIKTLVEKHPNNMKLGKHIRSYFFKLEEEETYIYESPDGGVTVYRRKFNNYDTREVI